MAAVLQGGKRDLTDQTTSFAAIAAAGDEDKLIRKISINSPLLIEDAAPLTPAGMLSICKLE